MIGCTTFNKFSSLYSKNITNQRCVYIDPKFSGIEKKILQGSFEEWTNKTGGYFQWKYQDWPKDYQAETFSSSYLSKDCSKHLFVVRGISSDAMVTNAEARLGQGLWGYAHRTGLDLEYILLVADKIESYNNYRLVALHEIGHILGLDHNKELSIMNSSEIATANGITQFDLEELWKIYGTKG